jgi:hypothetical protein
MLLSVQKLEVLPGWAGGAGVVVSVVAIRADLYGFALFWGFDHLAVTEVDADVVDVAGCP